jgi:hypothetical protein
VALDHVGERDRGAAVACPAATWPKMWSVSAASLDQFRVVALLEFFKDAQGTLDGGRRDRRFDAVVHGFTVVRPPAGAARQLAVGSARRRRSARDE